MSEGISLRLAREEDTPALEALNGGVTSTITTPPEAIEQLRADLAAKGRALISIAVELYDESGVHSLSANVEWFIANP